MFRKTMIGAALIAAAAGAAVLAKYLKDQKENDSDADEKEEDDNEVHFIKIDDEENEEDEEDDLYDASGKSEEVQEVCGVYPYLDPDFVEEILGRNGEFNQMFDDDTLVQITHKVAFADHENLEKFLEIMEEAGYACVQVADGEMTVSKKLFTEEGALISDILNVANQTAALKGTYESQEISK